MICFVCLMTIVTFSIGISLRVLHNRNVENLVNSFEIQTEDEIFDSIRGSINDFVDNKNQYNYTFTKDNMPYGRVSSFLNYFNTSTYDEEPYLFLCKRSLKDNEFREYGTVITSKGIYLSKDNQRNAGMPDKEAAIPGKNIFYPFTGLSRARRISKHIYLTYVRPDSFFDSIKVYRASNDNEAKVVFSVVANIIGSEIGFSYLKNCIVKSEHEIPDKINEIFGSKEKAIEYYKKCHQIEKKINANGYKRSIDASAIQSVQPQMRGFYAENKNYMNGARGYGYAAEYGNNAVDRFLFKKVENAAQNLVNGHQAKAGADRIVNGVEIQTKYYQSASETIGAVFKHKQAIYIRHDGTEKMMAIEVPRDQYDQALDLMQKRIDNGQVPNVEKGETAKDYVRKGYFTYEQSFLIAQSGTIESLTVDALSGAVCSVWAAGISATIVFAMSLWSGQPVERALKQSLAMGIKVIGKGTLIYTLTMQLSRENFANIFGGKVMVNGIARGFESVTNPIFVMSQNIANGINETLLSSNLAKQLGLGSITGTEVIGGAVTAVVVFGPDIARALAGRISVKQLVKNTTIGIGGIAGSMIGQTLIPVPVVGAMIGGTIGGFATKVIMDEIVEDDAKEMFRILKEEFIDTVTLAGLSQDELEEVISRSVGYKKIHKTFQKMFQSKDYRNYARNTIMIPAIKDVISRREQINNTDYNNALSKLMEDEIA